MLSGSEIKELIKSKDVVITPYDESLVGPDSIDIRLGHEIMIAKNVADVIDSSKPVNFWERKEVSEKGFILNPNQFILGITLEKIGLSNAISAQIEGRSSVGRLGIMVHVTAGIIHAGFGSKDPSNITLEIYSVNPNPVLLKPGIKIAQLTFFNLNKRADVGYDQMKTSSYIGQDKPLPPRGL